MLSPNLAPVLKELYPLRNLSDAEINLVMAAAELSHLAKSSTLKEVGDKDTPFYILLNGRLGYSELIGEDARTKPVMVRVGEFFGADALLFAVNRSFEVVAVEAAQLISISTANLANLLVQIPALKTGLLETLALRKILQRKAFAWLQDTEQVKFLAIKHPAVLLEFLFWPAIWLLGGAFLLFLGLQMPIASFRIAFTTFGVIVSLVGLLWSIWQVIDWANDYYVVTDQRVVWLEQVFGLYESRREALLSAIKSSEVKTTQIGRILGYGNITVFALMGQISILHVANPDQIKVVIDRMQKVANIRLQQEDTQAMEKVIRRKIDPPPFKPAAPPAPKPSTPKRKGLKLLELNEYFNLDERLVKNDVITYRKHRIILLLKVFPPLLSLLLLVVGAIWLIYQNLTGVSTFPTALTTGLMAFIIAGGLFFWLWYQYMDWHDDIYVITPDRIIDSVKKPLGTEVTKSAPLGSIQNMDYERIGLLGLILNLGNVTINTGSDSHMLFLQVHDPAATQMDIFNRMYALKRKQQTAEASRQWEQVSDWLAAYHRQAEEMRRNQK